MKVSISVKIENNVFTSEFTPEHELPEYIIADEAWRLGLLFARTRAIAENGPNPTSYELSKMLEKLEYTYSIKN